MKQRIQLFSIFLILIFLTCGCATQYSQLTPSQTESVNKIATHISPATDTMSVIDHTGTMGKTYGGMQFGAIGGLIEGIILSVEANSKIKKSIGGDPDVVRANLQDFDITDSLNGKIANRLRKKYEVVDVSSIKIEDGYHQRIKEMGADTLVEVRFIYGLAAYSGEQSSPAITANLKITKLSDNSTLIKKRISSDTHYREGNVVEEFAKNDAQLFKTGIEKAAETMAILVASEFLMDKEGIPISNINSNANSYLEDSISYTSATCRRPYSLTQDCSNWTGPKRAIEIYGIKANISGSSDGKVAFFILDGSGSSEVCLEKVTSEFEKNNIKILRTIKLTKWGAVKGYFLELDGDGYSILKKYSL